MNLRDFNGLTEKLHDFLTSIDESRWNLMIESGRAFIKGNKGDIDRFLPSGLAKQLYAIKNSVRS